MESASYLTFWATLDLVLSWSTCLPPTTNPGKHPTLSSQALVLGSREPNASWQHTLVYLGVEGEGSPVWLLGVSSTVSWATSGTLTRGWNGNPLFLTSCNKTHPTPPLPPTIAHSPLLYP